MRDQRDLVQPELASHGFDDVGLLEQRVALVGLVGEPVPGHVDKHDAVTPGQVVEHPVPVVRRRREPVKNECWLAGRIRWLSRAVIDDEDPMLEHSEIHAVALPRTDLVARRRHAGIVSCAACPPRRAPTESTPAG